MPRMSKRLFTGGGATIRVADLVGKARTLIDALCRVYKQQEVVDVGLCQYLVEDTEMAMKVARAAAGNPVLQILQYVQQ